MNTIEKYKWQQTDYGKQVIQMLDQLKADYCKNLSIPPNAIKTGKITALVNAKTNEIERFIEG